MNKKLFKYFMIILNVILAFAVISFIVVKSHFLYLIPRIKTIKNLLPNAVSRVAENPRCYKVLTADVSYEYSSKDYIVFYVDCSTADNIFNIERFFVTEDELTKNK